MKELKITVMSERRCSYFWKIVTLKTKTVDAGKIEN